MPSPPAPTLRVAVVPVTPFQQNCSILWDPATMQGAIVDPGGDLDQVLAVLEREGITLEKMVDRVRKNNAFGVIRQQLLRQMVLDFLLKEAKTE